MVCAIAQPQEVIVMSDMKKAYEVAAIAVCQRFAEQRPEDLHVLNRLRKQDIAVYAGSFDRVEDILACLKAIAQIKADTLNFAQLQSAVTSTELIAQLCIRAARAVPVKSRSGIFAW